MIYDCKYVNKILVKVFSNMSLLPIYEKPAPVFYDPSKLRSLVREYIYVTVIQYGLHITNYKILMEVSRELRG